jgi:hypothetical protein
MNQEWYELRSRLDKSIQTYGSITTPSLRSTPLADLIDAFRSIYSFGGCECICYRFETDSLIEAHLGDPRKLREGQFMSELLSSRLTRAALPELPARDVERVVWGLRSVYELDGAIAKHLMGGGYCSGFQPGGAQAKRLAAAAVNFMTQERFEDWHVIDTYHPWSAWHADIMWDRTWVLANPSERVLWLLTVTESD